MKRSLIILLLVFVSVASGCRSNRVNRLTSERFPPGSEEQEVKLYVNEIQRPHVKIAQIQSFADDGDDKETKRRQLQELKETARKLGADAVTNVRQLNQRVRGMVRDEQTPFPAPKQGSLERHFLRGIAIRYVDEAEAELYAEPVAEAEAAIESTRVNDGIPQVEPHDPDEDSPSELIPRGLGPVFK